MSSLIFLRYRRDDWGPAYPSVAEHAEGVFTGPVAWL